MAHSNLRYDDINHFSSRRDTIILVLNIIAAVATLAVMFLSALKILDHLSVSFLSAMCFANCGFWTLALFAAWSCGKMSERKDAETRHPWDPRSPGRR